TASETLMVGRTFLPVSHLFGPSGTVHTFLSPNATDKNACPTCMPRRLVLGLPDHAHRRKSPTDVCLGDRPHPAALGPSNRREKRWDQASCLDRRTPARCASGPAHRPG